MNGTISNRKNTLFSFLFFLFCLNPVSLLCAQESISAGKIKALYNSLEPTSISQHLAFYELYGDTTEGKKALQDAYRLLSGGSFFQLDTTLPISTLSHSIYAIIGIINNASKTAGVELSDRELAVIDSLAQRLPNRKLLGYRAENEEKVLSLEPHQIDLARGVLLSQLGNDPQALQKIRSYEAAVDLMALQILTRISLKDSPKAKIRALNRFIFEEMGFRFPPHSAYAKDIDLYTFLPSVLDSRRGVCLGVSILYICLAQRLNLDLEIVTPPGHIFVRWKQGNETVNIETTARGIDLSDEDYLGVETRKLQQRNIKETIGMAHFNEASVFLERGEYEKAFASYLKAKKYLNQDPLLIALMGYTSILIGDERQGKIFLEKISGYLADYATSKDTMAEDYLNGKAPAEGIKAIFMHVNEERASLLQKKEALEKLIQVYPEFRDGLFSLAGTWLQLHRTAEGLDVLKKYHQIDPNNPTVEYYLCVLFAERFDYANAWKHLRQAEALVKARDHEPKALLDLRKALSKLSPE